MESVENIAPAVVKLVSKQMLKLVNCPLEGTVVLINEDNVTDIQAWIGGPDGTPYAGGYFRIKVVLVSDFPASPPKCFFLTKIYHPNISESGEVCVNSLKRDWKREFGIAHILLIVRALLYQPNSESALNQEAAMALNEDHNGFVRDAELMTSIHASHVPPDVQRALEAAGGDSISRGCSAGGNKSGRSSSAQVAIQAPKKRRVGPTDAAGVQAKAKKKRTQPIVADCAAANGKVVGKSPKEKTKGNSKERMIEKMAAERSAGGAAAGTERKRPQAGRQDEENIGEV